jgi:subtilisin family serine protease
MSETPAFFFYNGEQKVPLVLVEDTLVVGFNEPITERRLEELRSSDRRIEILGRSRALLDRNILIYRVGAVANGAEKLRLFAARLLHSPNITFISLVFRDPASGLYLIATDEVIVYVHPEVTPERVAALAAEVGAEVVSRSEYTPQQFVLRVKSGLPAAAMDAANALHQRPETEWAVPNFLREKELAFQERQYHLHNTGFQGGLPGEDSRVRGPAGPGAVARAWAITRGDPDVVIAVLDTGVDLTHPDIPLAPGGRDFDPATPDDDPSPSPDGANAHGTCCAGVVAGRGGLIDGAAPNCRILPIKMMGATDAALANAIGYAAQNARVLSNSWTVASNPATETAIRNAVAQRGTIVVFAAGNQNFPVTAGPQNTPGVILVGAANNIGGRSGYSNFGPPDPNTSGGRQYLSLLGSSDGTSSDPALWKANLAPVKPAFGPFEDDGSTIRIFTTDTRAGAGINNGTGGDPANTPVSQPDYTGTFGGTSSACPLVAGVCGLMVSVNRDLSPAQVRYLLEATADKIGTRAARKDCPTATAIPAGKTADYSAVTGYDGFTHTDGQRHSRYGFGRLNAEQAVRAAKNEPMRQFVRASSGNSYQDAIPVVLRRIPGTNQFISDVELELIEARRDAEALPPSGVMRVRGANGGELTASFQPPGGAPAISDAVSIRGQIV